MYKTTIGIIISIFFLVAFSSSPPIGRTGAPGESGCDASSGCHSTPNNSIQGKISLLGLPSNYQADSTYELTMALSILSGEPRMAGFQMTALKTDLSGIGIFSNAGDNSTVFSSSNNKSYFQHNPVINFGNDSIVNYTVQWIAPNKEESESVIFYVAANFANGDGGATNDNIVFHQFSSVPDTVNRDKDNDGFDIPMDCDDNNPAINPDATEIANNSIDENCDGIIEEIDMDSDGFNSDIDCDDNNPAINPDAMEIANNSIDENCDGIIEEIDMDSDGFNSDIDCDDNNPAINPDAMEIVNNSIDENCDGIIEEIDMDSDGFNSDTDCDDDNPAINPDAMEIVNNNIDENCDGIIEEIDMDSDGFNSDIDCDDNNPAINPDATEIEDNAIDENCDGVLGNSLNLISISGKISNQQGVGIAGVLLINENNGDTIIANSEGVFSINNIDTSTTKSISIHKNSNAGNGLSSIDLINILNHILGRVPFVNSTDEIAADVNNDQKISSLDLIIITNVILGKSEDFNGRESWIFIPDQINLNSDSLDHLNVNISGIKTGDVTGDANPKN